MALHFEPMPPGAADRPARLRLFGFHHAGGSAAGFAGWQVLADSGIAFTAVELPCRRGGMAARMPTLPEIAAEAARRIASLAPAGPVALYGHSLGALIAFEVALAMRCDGREPLALCVSGRRAPHRPLRGLALSEAPDDELVAQLGLMGGIPSRLLQHPRWRETQLPVLRRDLALSDLYRRGNHPPLNCPILGYLGLSDPVVDEFEFAAWRLETLGACQTRRLPGGHFFHGGGRPELVPLLAADLLQLIDDQGAPAASDPLERLYGNLLPCL